MVSPVKIRPTSRSEAGRVGSEEETRESRDLGEVGDVCNICKRSVYVWNCEEEGETRQIRNPIDGRILTRKGSLRPWETTTSDQGDRDSWWLALIRD